MRRPHTLTARLVAAAVALVTAVSVVLGVATLLVARSILTDRLDQDVADVLHHVEDGPPGPRGDDRIDLRNQAPHTLIVVIGETKDEGVIVGAGRGEFHDLTEDELEPLRQLGGKGPASVELPGLGDYRVVSTDDGGRQIIVGLPTDDVDEAVGSLISVELVLVVVAVLAAAGVGTYVVRRQLRPLTEVAETAHAVAALPLASGEIGVTERVPEHLTDERTEVGQVGAALNTLLAHVETSLDARHLSEQRVRQFVADASHELRTPLTTIVGYAELARRHPDDPEAAATALAKVEEESARMTALVEDLLLLARLDSGRPLAREPVDLTRLLLEAVSDARVIAPEHRWYLFLPDTTMVIGDELRLHQVVTNLLTNAHRHTPPGTHINVNVLSDGFFIEDDGPGFPPDLVERAFERFARGDASRHREGGAGLGLALVEAIVLAHGGRVHLESRPGNTRISVSIG